jgi:hypothetical protein
MIKYILILRIMYCKLCPHSSQLWLLDAARQAFWLKIRLRWWKETKYGLQEDRSFFETLICHINTLVPKASLVWNWKPLDEGSSWLPCDVLLFTLWCKSAVCLSGRSAALYRAIFIYLLFTQRLREERKLRLWTLRGRDWRLEKITWGAP